MRMATSVAELISSELRYSDGSPVECVVAETCIGGVAEAASAAALFSRSNVGVTITVTPCWCYGTETMDMSPSTQQLYGALTAPSGQEPYIWLLCCLHMHRREFLRSASMVKMCRTAVIRPFR